MKALESRRYFHESTGEPMPAYVIGDYVVEKNRRDWNFRVAGQYVGSWVGAKEWWEVRRQHSRAMPGCSVGPELFSASTLLECREWVEAQQKEIS